MSGEESAGGARRRRGPRLGLVVVAACLILLITVGAMWTTGIPGGLPAVFDWQRREYQAPGSAATLSDIQDVDQLAALFNADEGIPRLILLFAPT
ncbi:MAG: hypothetical protein ACRDZO_18350 [Egibacteraceae bacterium]